jgi:hypothetical protein
LITELLRLDESPRTSGRPRTHPARSDRPLWARPRAPTDRREPPVGKAIRRLMVVATGRPLPLSRHMGEIRPN